jgi:phosphate acetyltransferase
MIGGQQDGGTMEANTQPGREKYHLVLAMAHRQPAVATAVVHPCDEVSLAGAVEAHRLGLIAATLVAPEARLRALADKCGIDIAGLPLVASEHSHDSAAKAVALVRAGKADALMKGSLHTDEFMAAVVAHDTGLRTERRISHCYIMDVPGRAAPLIVTDAAVNISPTLAEKADIVRNAIDLAHALGLDKPLVEILSATEEVNPAIPSTIEAAALCKMADRGQILGGILDGPLALDNAIDPQAADIKHIVSPVAGRANILVVPNLEAGNMLAKSLSFMAGAESAGIVMGARVPIILTSRADSVVTRLASCAGAVLVAAWQRRISATRQAPDHP